MEIFMVIVEVVGWTLLGVVCLNILLFTYIIAEGKGMPTIYQTILCLLVGFPYLLCVLLLCEFISLCIAWQSRDALRGRRIFPR